MTSRRQSTIKKSRPSAPDNSRRAAQRLDQIEIILRDMHATLDTQFKRIAALQAQVDHLVARIGR